MSIGHHLSDEWIVDYASGSLSEGWSLVVATHLALCPSCRRRLDLAERVGGELLAQVEPHESATDHSWEAMRRRLQQPRANNDSDPAKTARPAASGVASLPEPLRSYAGADIDGLRWRALGRGAYHIRLETGDDTTSVRLLRIPAGKPVPEHSHSGRELTLVLSGSFADGEDIYARGDIEDADDSVTHQPVATPDADCICLAVTEAPLRFKSWLVRIVQPILGI
ncbi:transcriptional regulator [Mesorhizobium sp. NBSH29]|uniref:ChrR family anti-sigma-E factor n=1 Tax=Mesorhizobium sp. NBSH29 TaxID=2654249 RepID=UPI001896751C|nr:ChrR family anti-sigma-E factor [Mesorhizobium sp. NBSH29]QPC86789.1 transcriptional regulator [Mesorhizobium sp. NBSH29]